jgi:predicted nucleic acid-binding protein
VTPSTSPELRAVLDTQVLLRGAMAKNDSLTSKIYNAWREGSFLLLLSEPIVQEIEDVVGRPEVLQKLRFSPVEAGALLLLLRRQGQFVVVTSHIMWQRFSRISWQCLYVFPCCEAPHLETLLRIIWQ